MSKTTDRNTQESNINNMSGLPRLLIKHDDLSDALEEWRQRQRGGN